MNFARSARLLALLLLVSAPAFAQSSPGFTNGQVVTVPQWNSYFSGKVDGTGGALTNPTVTNGTISGTDLGLGVVTATPGTATKLPLGNVVGNVGATANQWCWVGDSITVASTGTNSLTITASGGTAPYTFSAVTGMPAGLTATVGSNAVITSTSPAWPGGASGGSSTITVAVTDNVSATGSQQFLLTYNLHGQITLTPTGTPTGTVALTWTGASMLDLMRGPSVWTSILTNRRIISPQTLNFGHGGDTTAGILARISDIVSANCAGYVVMIGTNDLNNAGSPSIATIEANLSSIWSQLLATGRPVVAMTILPRTEAQPANAVSLDMLWTLNRYIKAQRGAINNLFVVDPSVYYGDPLSATATPRTGATSDYTYSYDGLHPKAIGAFAVVGPLTASQPNALSLTALFNQRYPDPGYKVSANTDLYSSTNLTGNLLPNGMMSFSGATGTVTGRATGVSPDGWTLFSQDAGCSPCTYVITGSQASLTDGTQAAQFVFSGTAGGGFSTSANLAWTTTSFGNYSIGDKLQASCRFEVDAGSSHITPPTLSLIYKTGVVQQILAQGVPGSVNPTVSDASPTVAYSGTLATPLPAPPLIGSLSGTLTFQVSVYITNSGSQTIAGTIRVSACRLEKVT